MRGFTGLEGITATVLLVGSLAVPVASADGADGANGAVVGAAQPTLYVDQVPGCSDSGAGSRQVPFCTIQAAANLVDPGQTVDIIGGGPGYAGPITIRRSGTPQAPITFAGSGSVALPALRYSSVTFGEPVLFVYGVHDVRISNLEVVEQEGSDGIDVTGSQDVSIDRVVVQYKGPYDGMSGISVGGNSSAVTVSRSTITSTAEIGVRVQFAQGVTVSENAIAMPDGVGISLFAANGTDVIGNSVAMSCGNALTAADLVSAVVENNVLASGPGTSTCTTNGSALLVGDPGTAKTTQADYNVVSAGTPGTEYDWAGNFYASAAAFNAATGQGAHDLDLASFTPADVTAGVTPALAIDSADCDAPGELDTDWRGHPHVRDPVVTPAGNGTCYADRGAFELQDSLPLGYATTPSSAKGTAPLTLAVKITSGDTGGWGLPVLYSFDFGDGSGQVPAASGATVTHGYRVPGQYLLTVTATDSGGSVRTSQRQVIVWSTAVPKVTLSATPEVQPNGVDVPDTADFSVGAAADGWELRACTIDFGDGTTLNLGSRGTASHAYALPGTYTATLTETDQFGGKIKATVRATVGEGFDSTLPVKTYSGPLAAHAVLQLIPVSRNGIEGGAFLLVTVSSPKTSGYLTVYPDGAARPKDPTIQFRGGRAASNVSMSMPADADAVDCYNGSSGPVHLTVYALGFASNQSTSDSYYPDGPVRVLGPTRVAAGGNVTLTVAGRHGVPALPDEALLDVTAADTRAAGDLSAYRPRAGVPVIPQVYWAAGQMVTGLVMVSLANGKIVLHNASKGSAVFTADLVGYYQFVANGSMFLPLSPDRLLAVRIGPRQSVRVPVGSKDGLPARGISAAAVNLMASGASRSGTIAGWADGTTRPVASALSYGAGSTMAGAALVPVGADGAVDLYNSGSSPVTVTVDLTGAYYQYP